MARIFNSVLFNSLHHVFPKNGLGRAFHPTTLNMLKVGDKLPSIDLHEGNPGNVINIAELCKGKKVVIFGVPGAYTPGCSKTHLPGYVERYFDFKKKGVDEVVCIAVNDTFVLEAWGKEQNATGKVRMLSDVNADFVKAAGLEVEVPILGGIRSKRYSMLVTDGVVNTINVEPDSFGLSCSLASRFFM